MIYRQSQLGQCLEDALADLDSDIDPALRQRIARNFDEVRVGRCYVVTCPFQMPYR